MVEIFFSFVQAITIVLVFVTFVLFNSVLFPSVSFLFWPSEHFLSAVLVLSVRALSNRLLLQSTSRKCFFASSPFGCAPNI